MEESEKLKEADKSRPFRFSESTRFLEHPSDIIEKEISDE
jgi:hypothetical protein